MPHLSRKMRVLKWCGAIGVIGVYVLFIGSSGYSIILSDPGGRRLANVDCGNFIFVFPPRRNNPVQYSWKEDRWSFTVQASTPSLGWRLRYFLTSAGEWCFVVPLWLPFGILAVPTGYLFWRDRRRPLPGHCGQCGYNLTGNTSGVCPECGTRAK